MCLHTAMYHVHGTAEKKCIPTGRQARFCSASAAHALFIIFPHSAILQNCVNCMAFETCCFFYFFLLRYCEIPIFHPESDFNGWCERRASAGSHALWPHAGSLGCPPSRYPRGCRSSCFPLCPHSDHLSVHVTDVPLTEIGRTHSKLPSVLGLHCTITLLRTPCSVHHPAFS